MVLLIMRHERQREEGGNSRQERQGWGQRSTFDERRHEPLHEQVENADTCHDQQVGHYRPKDALLDVGLPRL